MTLVAASETNVTVAVVGMGQIGSELAAGLRAASSHVEEVHRGELGRLAGLSSCRAAILAVPEDALAEVVSALPLELRERVVLVQNELSPSTWRGLGLARPTVAVVWFEKKGGRAPKPLLPTPVAGPCADLVVDAIARRGLPALRIAEGRELIQALVAKNLYIVVANLAGLAASRIGELGGARGGVAWPNGLSTMGELLGAHRAFARALGEEVFAIEQARLDAPERDAVDFEAAWSVVEAATAADPDHACMGRSAPARLVRAAARARDRGVHVPIVDALGFTQRDVGGPE